MHLADIHAKRAESEEVCAGRWHAVDLVCDAPADGNKANVGEREIIARTKLIRDTDTAGVCLSEAIGHQILTAVGLVTAAPFAVNVTESLAKALTAQYNFAPPVVAGRHWGTRLIVDAVETTIQPSHYAKLTDPGQIFLIYLVDVLTAYGDRQTGGNVLLLPVSAEYADIVPIDQSDCFVGPSVLRDYSVAQLCAKSHTDPFAGMTDLIIERGRQFVDEMVDRIRSRSTIIFEEAIQTPPKEWYERAGVTPEKVREVLKCRLDNFESLARLPYWRGMKDAATGNYEIFGA